MTTDRSEIASCSRKLSAASELFAARLRTLTDDKTKPLPVRDVSGCRTLPSPLCVEPTDAYQSRSVHRTHATFLSSRTVLRRSKDTSNSIVGSSPREAT